MHLWVLVALSQRTASHGRKDQRPSPPYLNTDTLQLADWRVEQEECGWRLGASVEYSG